MKIIDRHILLRFLGNFALLFATLFVFAISVDIVIQWDKFLDAATRMAKERDSSSSGASAFDVAALILSFHGPRVFQFYQYMMPLVAMGAMGFTACAMHRSREFTALLAAGVSLRRTIAPILVGGALLCSLQVANQEFILPRLAPRLLLDHSDLVHGVAKGWGIPLATDSSGRLIHAARFDPATKTLVGVYVVERAPDGTVSRRVEATSATWSDERNQWVLKGGRAGAPVKPGQAPTGERHSVFADAPLEALDSDLDPRTLQLRQHALYAHMLSLREIAALSDGSAVDPAALRRYAVGRFSSLAVALCMLAISIPFFALREPANLLAQSVLCAAVGLPLLLMAMVFLSVPIPRTGPTLGVVLPVAALLPIAAWRLSAIKT